MKLQQDFPFLQDMVLMSRDTGQLTILINNLQLRCPHPVAAPREATFPDLMVHPRAVVAP